MINSVFSGQSPRSLPLTILLIAIFFALLATPFLFPGARALETAARIVIFITLVASYDLLIGYTGIVSFAHTVFFGLGAYGVALTSAHLGPGWSSIALGAIAGTAVAVVLAFLVALFSLRVRAIFFAMITMAVAAAIAVLVSQLSWLTGGEDGINLKIPRELTPAFKLESEIFGIKINGKILNYYMVFGCSLLLFLALLRVVSSPFGRVLQAIRENPFRAEAIGYRVVVYRSLATCLAAAVAALSGALFAIWLRYVGPDTTLAAELMIDILLMTVIGGMGTLWGAVIGATIFVLAQSYLQLLMARAAEATAGWPLLPDLLNPDRWLLWLGLLFILSVYFFPTGIVGRLRARG